MVNQKQNNITGLKNRLKKQLDREAHNWAKNTLGNGPLALTGVGYMGRMQGSDTTTLPRVKFVTPENIKLLYNTRHLTNNHQRLLKLVRNNADHNIHIMSKN
jgi:hypothetical protein